VAPFEPLDALAWSDLRAALTGGAAPAGASALYVPLELREELERAVDAPMPPPGAAGAVRWVSQAEIPAALAADERALGLLPLEAVDYRVRSLALDGLDPVRGSGPFDEYPLANRLWLTIDREAVEDSAPALEAAVESLVNILELHFQSQARLPDGQAAPRPIRLLATGDIIPARCVYARQLAYQDFRHAFLATADVLRAADSWWAAWTLLSDAMSPLVVCAPSVPGAGAASGPHLPLRRDDCGLQPCRTRRQRLRRSALLNAANLRRPASPRSAAVATWPRRGQAGC
jgi:hypothetical protein